MTLADLTPRQQDVLRGIASGKTAKQLARDLGIEPRTVHAHTSLLYLRLGIRGRTNLVRRAIELGL